MVGANEILLEICVYHDGQYWIADVVKLGLLSADPKKEKAVDDLRHMIYAQFAYAARYDPEQKGLWRDMPRASTYKMHFSSLRDADYQEWPGVPQAAKLRVATLDFGRTDLKREDEDDE